MICDEITLRAAQTYWKERGWYHGIVDGRWGAKSAMAHGQHAAEESIARHPASKLGVKPAMRVLSSPNRGVQHKPSRIILHHCSGTRVGTPAWVMNDTTDVSYHFWIEPDGKITQFVDPDFVAWHCKGHNTGSIGISYQGDTTTGEYRTQKALTAAELDATIRLIAWLKSVYTITSMTTHRALDRNKNDVSPEAERQVRDAVGM